MVKGATDRLDKYNAKIDADAIRIRIANYKTKMGQNFQTRAESVATTQAAIRTQLNLLNGANVIYPAFTAPYMACGMEILGLQNKGYGDSIMEGELSNVFDKWEARGCTESGLNAVAAALEVPLPY